MTADKMPETDDFRVVLFKSPSRGRTLQEGDTPAVRRPFMIRRCPSPTELRALGEYMAVAFELNPSAFEAPDAAGRGVYAFGADNADAGRKAVNQLLVRLGEGFVENYPPNE